MAIDLPKGFKKPTSIETYDREIGAAEHLDAFLMDMICMRASNALIFG